MPVFQDNGRFSRDLFMRIAQANRVSPVDLIERIRNSLIFAQFQSSIIDTAFLVPTQMQKTFNLLNQKRDIGYLIIDSKGFARDFKPSQASINNYYQQHQKDFKSQESVALDYILLSPKDVESGITITDKMVKDYYSQHAADLRSPARWRVQQLTVPKVSLVAETGDSPEKQIQQIYNKLKTGKLSWADAAKQPGVLVRGRWLVAGDIPDTWVSSLQSIKDYDLSKPLSGPHGMAILKRLQYQAPKPMTFKQAQPNIRERLKSQQAQSQLAKLNQQASNLAYMHPDSLDPVAKALKLPVLHLPAMTRQGLSAGVGAEKEVISAAFSDEVLKQKVNSAPIMLSDGRVLVVRMASYSPAKVKDLSEVKSEIITSLRHQAAIAQAHKLAGEVRQQLEKGVAGADVAKQHKLQWKQAAGVIVNAPHVPPIVAATAFQIPVSAPGHYFAKNVTMVDGNVAVVMVNKISEVKKSPGDSEMKQAALAVSKMRGQTEFKLYGLGFSRSLKIHIVDKKLGM